VSAPCLYTIQYTSKAPLPAKCWQRALQCPAGSALLPISRTVLAFRPGATILAYRDFLETLPGGALPALTDVASAASANATGFSPLEWTVIMIARGDRPSSLREPGRTARWFMRIFGETMSRRLADPRLEALRRMAVLSWHHGYLVPAHELHDFIDAGFTEAQHELLGARVAALQNVRQPRQR
jgi:hypothetical protein